MTSTCFTELLEICETVLGLCPKDGGSLHGVHSCKVWIGIAELGNQDQAWNQQNPPLWSSGLAVDCVTEFACHYLICSKQSQGIRTLLFPFDESAIWQAIYLFTVCHCRYNSSNFIIFHKGRYKYLRKPLVLINRGNIVFRWETVAAAQGGHSI